MKRIVFLVCVLVGITSYGQVPGYTQWYKKDKQTAMMLDSGLHVPTYNGTPSGVRTGVSIRDGAVAADTTNNKFYLYSGGAWREIIDTANKWVNSITREAGKDSIIFNIGGTRYAIKDSTGGGGISTTTYLQNPVNADSLLAQKNDSTIWVKSVSVDGLDPVEATTDRTDSTLLHTVNIRQTFLDSIRNGDFGVAGATRELDNLTTTAINAHLLPGADGTIDLGSGTLAFEDLHLDTLSTINFNNGNVLVSHSNQRLSVKAGASTGTDLRTESPSGSQYIMHRAFNDANNIFDHSGNLSWRIANTAYASFSTTSFTINSQGSGQDFQWRSGANTHAFFGDASANALGINLSTPSGAFMHFGAGTTTFSPLKLTSGTDLTTATVGSFEFGSVSAIPRLAFTPTGTSRRRVMLSNDLAPANGQIGIGNGTDYVAANITSTDGSITVSNGAGTIDIETTTTLASGLWTPSLTNTTNISASTAYELQYMRVGDVVTISGKVDITTTATGASELRMSLPVTGGNFSTDGQAGGTAHPVDKNTGSIGVTSNSGSLLVAFKFISDDTSAHTYWFSFTYQVMPT